MVLNLLLATNLCNGVLGNNVSGFDESLLTLTNAPSIVFRTFAVKCPSVVMGTQWMIDYTTITTVETGIGFAYMIYNARIKRLLKRPTMRLQWSSLSLVLYVSIYFELESLAIMQVFHGESWTLFEITYGHVLLIPQNYVFMLPAYNWLS